MGAVSSRTCASASACTAFGSSHDQQTFAERWNGTRWTIQPTPTAPSTLDLNEGEFGVSCPSASTCTAVGSYRLNSQGFNAETLAERWNG